MSCQDPAGQRCEQRAASAPFPIDPPMLKFLRTYWLWIVVPIALLAVALALALTRGGSAEFGYPM